MRNLRSAAHQALAVAVIGSAFIPAASTAGTFHVYGLGMNAAGCPDGWQAQTSSPWKFIQRNNCSSWTLQTNRDGTPLRYGEFATASMFAGDGARFTGFSIRSTGTARNGTVWKMAMCTGEFSGCQSHFPQSGTWYEANFELGNVASGLRPFHAKHVWAGVACEASSCADSDAAGRAVSVTQRDSHAIVEDFTPPGAPAISGVATGWNSGPRQLGYSASDAGSGIADATVTIDGVHQRENVHGCARAPAGGYTAPVPCATSTGGSFSINEQGQLADGRHSLTVTVRDAAGEGASTSQEFLVDNNSPGSPIGLTVEGGDGWRSQNAFNLTWSNPDQASGSPIVAAFYKVGAAPVSRDDGVRVAGDGITRLDGIRVPSDGDWPLHVWLQDAAGNLHHGSAGSARLRLDASAPRLAFRSSRDAYKPAEVRVPVVDGESGVAGGQIELRRDGAVEWRALETRQDGGDLVADVPDDQLRRGTYELQASAWDLAGNRATTTVREDGRAMRVELPLRANARLSARLTRRARGAARAGRVLTVGYRRRAWVRGSLRAGGEPLDGVRLSIEARPPGGSWRNIGQTVTDARGRYRAALGRGTSRVVRVRFAGSSLLRPAAETTRLRVRAWTSLRLRPSRLRRGGRIAFIGRVGRFDAAIPAGGKLIQIQYLDGRRWRPAVKLGRTDRHGRFAIRYRFRRISRPTQIYFRILVPAESGWPYATGRSRIRVARVRP